MLRSRADLARKPGRNWFIHATNQPEPIRVNCILRDSPPSSWSAKEHNANAETLLNRGAAQTS